MRLAELETFLSRPIAPTRRVALGRMELPVDPAPGFGGILLGGIAARFAPDVDPDLHAEVLHLMVELERGQRIAQPRLRHRLQQDHVGLQSCVHRLFGSGDSLQFAFDEDRGTAAQHLLCAVYAAGAVDESVRTNVMGAVRKGFLWRGGSESALVSHLAGSGAHGAPMGVSAAGDPVSWALGLLELQGESAALVPTRREIQQAFRDRLRAAHPDHGATDDGAAGRIAELSEARRILLG